jgi:hypothetical protein
MKIVFVTFHCLAPLNRRKRSSCALFSESKIFELGRFVMSLESELLRFRPINPGDPGPEIFHLLPSLSPEVQREVIALVTDARAKIAQITADTHKQMAQAIRGGALKK